jgi:hypothetical protein
VLMQILCGGDAGWSWDAYIVWCRTREMCGFSHPIGGGAASPAQWRVEVRFLILRPMRVAVADFAMRVAGTDRTDGEGRQH